MLYKAEDLGSNDTVVVRSANAVWIDDDFSPRNRYVSLLEKDFDAFLDVESFADPATVHAINNWCSEHTNGKITGIIDRLNPGNVMVLVNALYFNAPWEVKFDPRQTVTQIFNGVSKDSEVKMMHRKGYYMYAEYQGFQMIRLPYEGLEYAMYVILPPVGADIDRLIAKHSRLSPSRALMLQAIGAERIEALCDAFCNDRRMGRMPYERSRRNTACNYAPRRYNEKKIGACRDGLCLHMRNRARYIGKMG